MSGLTLSPNQGSMNSATACYSVTRQGRRLSGGEGGKVRLLVVGGRGVGKTALTVRYLTRRYIGEYIPNTGRDEEYISETGREEVYIPSTE